MSRTPVRAAIATLADPRACDGDERAVPVGLVDRGRQHLVVHVDVVGRVLRHDAVAGDEQLDARARPPSHWRATISRSSPGVGSDVHQAAVGAEARPARRPSRPLGMMRGPGISPRVDGFLGQHVVVGLEHAGADDQRVAALEERPGHGGDVEHVLGPAGAAATPAWSNTKSSGQLMCVWASQRPGSTVAPRRSTTRVPAGSTSSPAGRPWRCDRPRSARRRRWPSRPGPPAQVSTRALVRSIRSVIRGLLRFSLRE